MALLRIAVKCDFFNDCVIPYILVDYEHEGD